MKATEQYFQVVLFLTIVRNEIQNVPLSLELGTFGGWKGYSAATVTGAT